MYVVMARAERDKARCEQLEKDLRNTGRIQDDLRVEDLQAAVAGDPPSAYRRSGIWRVRGETSPQCPALAHGRARPAC